MLMNDHISLIGDKNNLHDKMEKGKPRELKVCAQCNKEIEGKFMLRALGQFWHEECLKCSYCSTQLTDLSFKFYLKGDLILCKRDYIRLFGATGVCSLCMKTIPPLEMVMRAREHIYHLDCFACQVCRYRFCVGDKFYLHFNTVLCEADYYDLSSFFNQLHHHI
ncbi:unnamed protein product [Porites evermanni]|uniref:LIM zinc-binding domain-containing protein n=1 Tax=Porites evermanni TaxID=104178 RepID=A0ABN8M5U0_9CNID|nr:unnamed protein product [Porites evermanni]